MFDWVLLVCEANSLARYMPFSNPGPNDQVNLVLFPVTSELGHHRGSGPQGKPQMEEKELEDSSSGSSNEYYGQVPRRMDGSETIMVP